jgi:invasion protein IalB
MPLTFRLASSAIATVLALSPLPCVAQASGPTAKSKQSAPKDQKAQPQTPAPVIVELKAAPFQPEWTKVCGPDQNAKDQTCYTTRDFVTDKGQRIVAVALYDVKGKGAQKTMRIMMPLGFLVPPGIRIMVDKSQPTSGRYATCVPHGCFAEAAVKDDFVAALKKSSTLSVSAQNQAGKEVTFAVPTAGFGKAFDGPPIDPQVLADQQKKIQEELQKQAEEVRARQMPNPGSPAEAPAANAGTTAPKN